VKKMKKLEEEEEEFGSREVDAFRVESVKECNGEVVVGSSRSSG
jgi:hypothetical protein